MKKPYKNFLKDQNEKNKIENPLKEFFLKNDEMPKEKMTKLMDKICQIKYLKDSFVFLR